ncbi:hypothetical protein [Bacillus solimangrovi]|uniref:Uncharacterized protein n=1 Tax=Bacillus solimangrovi TaxID=1305675 RepID=A0A1E5LFJ2_9BACI|nr:hypothetical protein [Bacillus solimangrovi]OEH92844.1 hypothetical protein BFG57_02290 [Bacillus solimangrovi]
MRVTISLIIFLSFSLFVSGCEDNYIKPNSAQNTTWLMKLAIENNDYEEFNSLFSDNRKDTISKGKFNELQDIITARSLHSNYELITFDNDKMLLVRLTPLMEDNKVKVEDVLVVPQHIQRFFNKEDFHGKQ